MSYVFADEKPMSPYTGRPAIGQAKLLQDFFGIPRQGFVFLIGLLRLRELYQLHLLELVLPDDAAPSLPWEPASLRKHGV